MDETTQEQVPALAAHYRRFGIECDELLMEEEHSNWRVGAEGEGKWVQVTFFFLFSCFRAQS